MKKNLLIATLLASALFCIPAQAEESTVVQSGALTQDEQTQAFLDAYSADLDALIELCNGDSYSTVTDYMLTIGYVNMVTNLPYDGFCYPSSDGNGLKIMSDYLYYGTLINGVAEGQGKMYRVNISKNYDYGYFIGEWENDAPNGYGESWVNKVYRTSQGKDYTVHIAGNYINWYQDGDILFEYFRNGGSRTYRYHVTDMIPDELETITRQNKNIPVVAYAEETTESFLAFYGSGQTVLQYPLNDGNNKNQISLYNTGL